MKPGDGYAPIGSIKREISEAVDGWMRSPGHRKSVLDPKYKKVNIGIAWDRYNEVMFAHFEGDYVEYDVVPTIGNGILMLSGKARNGMRFTGARDLSVQVWYDRPPHRLTAGQLSRTYCYDNGRLLAKSAGTSIRGDVLAHGQLHYPNPGLSQSLQRSGRRPRRQVSRRRPPALAGSVQCIKGERRHEVRNG